MCRTWRNRRTWRIWRTSRPGVKKEDRMPKERIIPGYFDEIAKDRKTKEPEETVSVPQADLQQVPVADTTPSAGRKQMKGKKSPMRRKAHGENISSIQSRAFIPDNLNIMLGIYRLRIRHLRNRNCRYGDILLEAFLYYLKNSDREAYDDFKSQGLIQ